MPDIKDINPEGDQLTEQELKQIVGGHDCPQPRSLAPTYHGGVCKWDETGNDAPILSAY